MLVSFGQRFRRSNMSEEKIGDVKRKKRKLKNGETKDKMSSSETDHKKKRKTNKTKLGVEEEHQSIGLHSGDDARKILELSMCNMGEEKIFNVKEKKEKSTNAKTKNKMSSSDNETKTCIGKKDKKSRTSGIKLAAEKNHDPVEDSKKDSKSLTCDDTEVEKTVHEKRKKQKLKNEKTKPKKSSTKMKSKDKKKQRKKMKTETDHCKNNKTEGSAESIKPETDGKDSELSMAFLMNDSTQKLEFCNDTNCLKISHSDVGVFEYRVPDRYVLKSNETETYRIVQLTFMDKEEIEKENKKTADEVSSKKDKKKRHSKK